MSPLNSRSSWARAVAVPAGRCTSGSFDVSCWQASTARLTRRPPTAFSDRNKNSSDSVLLWAVGGALGPEPDAGLGSAAFSASAADVLGPMNGARVAMTFLKALPAGLQGAKLFRY